MPGRATSSAATEARLPEAMYRAMQSVMDVLFAQTDEDGRDISEMYHELVPKRALPDYYRVIKTPMAMNIVQNSIKKKTYSTFSGFVRDCAQIFHNAKVYNRPGSAIYEDAVTLENVLQKELRKLNSEGTIDSKDTHLPDLGPLPPPSPTGSDRESAGSGNDDDDDQDDEDDEPEEDGGDDDDDEEEMSSSRRKTRRRRAAVAAGNKRGSTADDDEDSREFDPRKKRGRPLRGGGAGGSVRGGSTTGGSAGGDTPTETRIKNIMKGLRRAKDEEGDLRVAAFETLPDRKQLPDYYETITRPIALDVVKRKIQKKEYKTVEQFEADIRLMCENAKTYNEDDSDIFKDAVAILETLNELSEAEKSRDDVELMGGGNDAGSRSGTGRQVKQQTTKSIEWKGNHYVVGDWVHIANPNEPQKPTIGQIFRLWEESDGRKGIYVCWYYRPEQTVHPYDRRFYEHEVFKTNKHHDHYIDEVIDKCFVMFVTRYTRGRPKGTGGRKIYVCESRYNPGDKSFVKIKTWKSCLPEEVRSQPEYEMDLFDKQMVLPRLASPIAHMLQEGGEIPEHRMGVENAPPIVGGVYKSVQRFNNTPPVEATPPPRRSVSASVHPSQSSKASHAPEPQSVDYHENLSMTQMYKQAHAAAAQTPASPQSHHHHHGHHSQPPQTPTPQMHRQPYRPAPATPHHHQQPQQHQQQQHPHQHPHQPHMAPQGGPPPQYQAPPQYQTPMMRPGPPQGQAPVQHAPMAHVPNMYPVPPQPQQQMPPQQVQHHQLPPHTPQLPPSQAPHPQMYANPPPPGPPPIPQQQQAYIHPQHHQPVHPQQGPPPPPPQAIHHHIAPPQQHVQYPQHPQHQQQHMQYAPMGGPQGPMPPQHMAPQHMPPQQPVYSPMPPQQMHHPHQPQHMPPQQHLAPPPPPPPQQQPQPQMHYAPIPPPQPTLQPPQMQYAPPPPPPPPPPPQPVQQQQHQHQLMRMHSQQQQAPPPPPPQPVQQQQQMMYHTHSQQHHPQHQPYNPHPSPSMTASGSSSGPIPPSTFILPDPVTSGIPESVAQQFLRDDEGRILWFSVPPMEASTGGESGVVSGAGGDGSGNGSAGGEGRSMVVATVGGKKVPSHSLEYLARRKEVLERKRRRREEREKEEKVARKEEGKRKRDEMREVEKALGGVLKVWERELRV